MDDTSRRPRVLLIGSGQQAFRDYVLRQAAEHAELWLLEPDPPTWQSRYLVGSSSADTFSPEETVIAARRLASEQRIDAVFCYHEGMILAAAAAAQALGLPSPSVEAVAACRDKSKTRELLAKAGVGQPRFALVDKDCDIAQLAQTVRPPWVVKPRSLGASQGVVKIDLPAELATGLQIARSAWQAGMTNDDVVLVEEYVEGSEISVDGYFDGREYVPLFVARKRLNEAPYFEEMGHTVAGDDEYLSDASLMDFLAAAHHALEFHGAITHTEVRITRSGPRIIEVNGRFGGDLIPLLAERALNINTAWYALQLALGGRPGKPASSSRCSGIRFLRPDQPCVVDSVQFDVERARAAGLEGVNFQAIVQPGTELRLPPEDYVSRYAMLIADGHSAEECDRKLDAATGFVELASRALTGQPVPAAAPR
ncbi:MAG: acetyl-CoA carboxylase biotin carboxylase subunit family protein [Jatrophihabitantaceae bacterium]